MSISSWIRQLQSGDAVAATPLWRTYHRRLVELAHAQLAARHRPALDEEDIAQEAFAAFCQAAAAGRLPTIADRNSLWRLLFALTVRRIRDSVRREGRQRRGGGKVVSASDLLDVQSRDLDAFAGDEPDPAIAVAIADEFAVLYKRLPDEALRRIAQLQLEGFSDAAIATQLCCSLRTVERKKKLIRELWLQSPAD